MKAKPNHKSKNVRPGKSSGIKSTAKEVERRIREVADLLCSGFRRSEINEKICSRYGVGLRAVAEYTARAREMLMEQLGRPKPEHQSDVLGEYQRILHDKKAGHGDRLQALKGKRELLGLDPPKRAEISGPDGGKITIETKIDKPIDFTAVERELSKLGAIPSGNGERESIHSAGTNTETGSIPSTNGH